MLTSTQIYLHALAPGELPNTTGQFGHAAFLRLVETVAPDLSAALHENNGRQPFTVSPLHVPQRARVNSHLQLNEGASCSMRFTILEGDTAVAPTLYASFQAAFLSPWNEAIIRLGQIRFAVREVVTTPRADNWTGFTSFAELWERASRERFITLRFYSPTALSMGQAPGKPKRFELFPQPWLVFDSLCRKWNAFADMPLAEPNALHAWIDEHVIVADHAVNTTTLYFEKFAQKGFIGQVTYEISSDDADMVRGLNALADFALYAGVGYKTTWGMGQARRVRVGERE
ncbi:MAG: CRISPR-associated endoribonuclease Cas6 [Chloroflexi bacterium]|nr:CRISPR-associated endoribonuclease Cas6 [Chloroflexota bacterium]